MYKISDYKIFLDKIFESLSEKDIDITSMELDHLAYRTQTKEEFQEARKEFSKIGEIISENLVRGRAVPVYKLNEPLEYKGRTISYLELMAPAKGDQFEFGLEHVEFVTPKDLKEIMKKYPGLDFIDRSEEKDPNIILKLGDNLAVKFHNKSLLDTVSQI